MKNMLDGQASPNPAYPQLIHRVTGDCGSKFQNRNEFDKDNANILNAYISPIGDNKNKIVENSNSRTLYIPCQPNETYVVSKISSARFSVGQTSETPAINISASNITAYSSATSGTITTDDTAKYIIVFYYLSTADTLTEEEIRNSIQIEKSSTATDYTPHAEQNAPLTLGNIEAYEGDEIQIDFVQKAGYKKVTGARLVQNMGEYDFTGEETFTKSTSTNNVAFYTAMFSPQIKAADSNNYAISMYSNCFISYSANKIFGQDVVGVSVSTTKNVQFGLGANSEITTVEAFQQMLAQKNVSLVYPLETPVTTPITDPTLLAQLETLINMKTYKNITNIESTGADLALVIEFDYYQDMSTLNDRLDELEARIELLEE